MTRLPDLSETQLRERLAPWFPDLPDRLASALHTHYRELVLWSPRLALIGPGTVDEVIERHFGESLAALPLISEAPPPGGGEIVDLGSGAGFPGLVLAAARPRWRVTLVEARQRKWAFLSTVVRKAALSARCLDVRVSLPLPAELPRRIDLLTARAVRPPAEVVAALFERLLPHGRALLWAGSDELEAPQGFSIVRVVPLPGSERRRIVEYRADPVLPPAHRADRNDP